MTLRSALVGCAAAVLLARQALGIGITVPSVSGDPGSAVQVAVVLTGANDEPVALQVDVEFPQALMRLADCTLDPAVAALGFDGSGKEPPWYPGRVRLLVYPTVDSVGAAGGLQAHARLPDGVLATCVGTIHSNAPRGQTGPFALSNAMAIDSNMAPLPVSLQPGTVFVNSPPPAPGCSLTPVTEGRGPSALPLLVAWLALLVARWTHSLRGGPAVLLMVGLTAAQPTAAQRPAGQHPSVIGEWRLLSSGCQGDRAHAPDRLRCSVRRPSEASSWVAWDFQCRGNGCAGRVALTGGTFLRVGEFHLQLDEPNRVEGLIYDLNGTVRAIVRGKMHRSALRAYVREVGGAGVLRLTLPLPAGARDAIVRRLRQGNSSGSNTGTDARRVQGGER